MKIVGNPLSSAETWTDNRSCTICSVVNAEIKVDDIHVSDDIYCFYKCGFCGNRQAIDPPLHVRYAAGINRPLAKKKDKDPAGLIFFLVALVMVFIALIPMKDGGSKTAPLIALSIYELGIGFVLIHSHRK